MIFKVMLYQEREIKRSNAYNVLLFICVLYLGYGSNVGLSSSDVCLKDKTNAKSRTLAFEFIFFRNFLINNCFYDIKSAMKILCILNKFC